ncbi:hypothetical protein SASPL_107432 [Salvia splendens]|uniref:Transmembrane protein n=1 Tax=Salvia splendens TaxID=180675 RepID=A0A8X8YEU9_SALSN|nr:uncharacterized protein At5g23160-like [Salvia splendens]KAG6429382.1 hypothetical protein SASPL_107432 [Salvia splendens]
MAAAKKERKKGNRSSFLCSFAACFGISNKVSADHSDRKSLSDRHSRAAPPVNDQYTAVPLPEILKSREIDVVEQDEEEEEQEKKIAYPSPDQLITANKRRENRDELKATTTSSILKRTDNQRKLVSMPIIHQRKQKAAAVVDSTVGAVIVSVTLVVMIIWGKVWAIVCAAAWFYFVPRFRPKMDESYAVKFRSGESEGVDFDSWEYKKRVVLQGLLHRNQHL